MGIENLPVAILAGGLATRLKPLTERIPKALVEVAGRPFVDWQLEALAGVAGKTPPVMVLFDANVVLGVLLKRSGFALAAMAIATVPEPWLSRLSLANILFIVGRSKSGCIHIFETDSPFVDIRISFDDAAAPEFFEHLGNAANPNGP